MKIQVAPRFTSGEHVRHSLGNLCLQYLAMDCRSAGAAAAPSCDSPSLHAFAQKQLQQQAEEEQRQHEEHQEVHHEKQPEQRDAQAWHTSESSSIATLLLPDDNVLSVGSSLCFSDSMSSRHADHLEDTRLALPRAVSRLASIWGLSSCTEMSEDEVRLAEVNPVTFEHPCAPHQHPQKLDLAASASIDNSSSAPYGNQAQSSSRLSDDVDLPSDGESSLPAVYVSDCHCEGSLSPGASSMTLQRFSYPSDEPIHSRVKLMCSFGGKIMSRPIDGKMRYVGGETRIVAVNRGIAYEDFMSKMMQFYGVPLGLKYQLTDEDLDALISVSSDDDLQNMMEEYDKLESGGGVSRLRLFFFTSQSDYEASQLGLKDEAEDRRTNQEERYVDAINGIPDKSSGNHLEDDATGFRRLHNFTENGAKISQDVKTTSTAPSASSSSPSSPPLAPRQAHFKPQGMSDSPLQERPHKVTMNPSAFEGSSQEVDQDGAAIPSGTVYCDHQYRLVPESPRRMHHDVAVSRGGMHRVDSQTKLMRQSDQYMDRGSAPGLVDPWHDVQQPVSEMLLPRVEPQRLLFHQHKQIPQHHHQQAWPPQIELNLRMGETVQHCPSDVHRQVQVFHQPHQAVHQPLHQAVHQPHPVVQQPHQAAHLRLHHQLVAVHEGNPRNSEHQGFIPFPQGPVQQPHSQIPLGVAYQMGSAPSSPRVAGHERCSCAQQHSQVHRGITVSLSDQPYGRKPPHFGDQHTRNHGLVHSSRYCDNPSHCGEPLVWQQAPNHFTVSEVEQQEQLGNPWQHVHGTHTVHCHLPECQARNRLAHQYCDPPVFRETLLASHDQHESNKTRCSCISCHDQRGQQVEKAVVHSVYADMQDQVGDWIMHQRNDDGRIPTVGKVLCKAPVHKDEDLKKEYEVAQCVQSEPGLFLNLAQGGFESRRALATPVEGAIHHGNLQVRVGPMSRPLVPEDLQAHEDPKWHSKLVALELPAAVAGSWNISTLEPRVWSDVLPSVNARVPNRLTEEVKGNSLSKAAFVSNPVPTMEGANSLEKGSPRSDMFTGRHGHYLGADSKETLLRDERGRPVNSSGPICETATEVPPVQSCTTCTHGLSEALYKNGAEAPVAANGDAHLVVLDGILTGSLAPSHAASPWQAAPPANLSMTALEHSSNTLAFPVYDQSPLSSINFEPSEPRATPGGTNVDNGSFASRMSLTGLLADGMISSVLKSCSNEVSHQSGDLEVANLNSPKVNLSKVANNETEHSTETVLVGSVSLQPPILQGRGLSFTKADTVNVSLTVNAEGRGLPTAQNETNKAACEEDAKVGLNQKDAEAQSVRAKEPKVSAHTQAEAEARARGLQIIKNADLEDMRELGSGTFGTVFHGKWRGSDVAIKRIKASCFMSRPSQQERLISDFWKEACTLGQLHHPNVVAFYGVVPDGPGGTLATVTEYMVNGSLKQVLHKKDRTIDRRKRLFLAMDAAFGMEYLHSKNIVHFDLKCENLLVNMRDAHRPICKVGDFGLSKVKHQTLVSGGVRGTLPWMAPELLSGNGSMVTEKIDVFSFGVVMWELLTGEEPYASMHCGAIIGGIVNNTLRPSIPSWCDPGWRTLMERCWSGDPADRPSFTEVAKELRALAAPMNAK